MSAIRGAMADGLVAWDGEDFCVASVAESVELERINQIAQNTMIRSANAIASFFSRQTLKESENDGDDNQLLNG